MSLAVKVLLALVAGLATGLGIAASGSTVLAGLVPFVEPVGTLWVSAIRMTIVPLVVSTLIVAVGSAPDPKTLGRVGVRAILVFFAFLSAAALMGVLIAPPLVALLPIDAEGAKALLAGAVKAGGAAVEGAKSLPSVSQWIVDLVPVNPIKAAADGAMLPLIVFSLAFGAAITRIAVNRRAVLLDTLRGLEQASLTLVGWVLALAPIGVFALAVGLGAKLGIGAAGALAGYIVLVCGVSVLFSVAVLYPAAVVFGKVSLSRFARAALPPQAVAFSSRSSLASLPALLEAARDRLGLSESVTSFLLPLAVALFRCGAVIGQTVGAIFVARLYGIPLGPTELATIAVTGVVTTLSVPGIPGGSIILMVPVLLSVGLPPAGVGLLLGVDTIPDMFRTTANVTGDMTVAAILGRQPTTETNA